MAGRRDNRGPMWLQGAFMLRISATSLTMTCPRNQKTTSTVSGVPPGPAKPVGRYLWPASIMFFISSLWKRCWVTRSRWSGPEMTGLLKTVPNRWHAKENPTRKDPLKGEPEVRKINGGTIVVPGRNQCRLPFQGLFSVLVPSPKQILPKRRIKLPAKINARPPAVRRLNLRANNSTSKDSYNFIKIAYNF